MLLIQKEQQNRSSVGCVNHRARSIGLKLKLMILFTTLTIVSGFTEFAMLMSAGSMAATQSSYARIYNGIDLGVVITTKKGIKTHVYEKGKKYVYETAINTLKSK